MKYDIKIYDGKEEKETIRDLKYSQMIAIKTMLDRLHIKYLIKEGGDVVRVEYESKIIPESIWFSQDSFSIAGKDEQGRAATIVIKYDETMEINGKVDIPTTVRVNKNGFTTGRVTVQWGEEIEIKCHNPMAVAR